MYRNFSNINYGFAHIPITKQGAFCIAAASLLQKVAGAPGMQKLGGMKHTFYLSIMVGMALCGKNQTFFLKE